MKKLNLPEYSFSIKFTKSKKQIFDEIRKRYVSLTPEEWVRQNFLKYLVNEKNYPSTLIAVEGGLKLYNLKKRTDIVVYNNKGKPVLIAECKAPDVIIDEKVFDQIVRYNMALRVDYFVLTNGLEHYCCKIDYQNQSYIFLKEVPFYDNIR